MKRVCVVTGTRAEYHLLYPLLKMLQQDDQLELQLVVTGAHLSNRYGETYRDIEKDGFNDFARIPILDDKENINEAMAKAISGISAYFSENRPDMLILLGDRYETFCAAIVAMNERIPISHINGGDTTEGAVDECIRHSITKMSYLHFPSCEQSAKRIIQMGEDPNRVFVVGGLGIDNIVNQKLMTKTELEESLTFDLGDSFALLTFHPVTLEDDTAEGEFREVLGALAQFPQLRVLFTKANADRGGLAINKMIDDYVMNHPNTATAVFSLGMQRYLSAMNYAAVVIGNSSSGIIESPSFKVPVVNIGDRQKGRMQAENVINCMPVRESIIQSIWKALSPDYRAGLDHIQNPYGDGHAAEQILKHIKDVLLKEKEINLKKKFCWMSDHKMEDTK